MGAGVGADAGAVDAAVGVARQPEQSGQTLCDTAVSATTAIKPDFGYSNQYTLPFNPAVVALNNAVSASIQHGCCHLHRLVARCGTREGIEGAVDREKSRQR